MEPKVQIIQIWIQLHQKKIHVAEKEKEGVKTRQEHQQQCSHKGESWFLQVCHALKTFKCLWNGPIQHIAVYIAATK